MSFLLWCMCGFLACVSVVVNWSSYFSFRLCGLETSKKKKKVPSACLWIFLSCYSVFNPRSMGAMAWAEKKMCRFLVTLSLFLLMWKEKKKQSTDSMPHALWYVCVEDWVGDVGGGGPIWCSLKLVYVHVFCFSDIVQKVGDLLSRNKWADLYWVNISVKHNLWKERIALFLFLILVGYVMCVWVLGCVCLCVRKREGESGVHVCVCLCVCVLMCVGVCLDERMHVSVCESERESVVHVCVCVCVLEWENACVCVCVCVCVCTCRSIVMQWNLLKIISFKIKFRAS